MGAETTRQRPLHELLSREMVDIYVGPEHTHWILHEKLLCDRSRFFRNIFYSKPSAGGRGPSSSSSTKNQTYGLPDEDDAPFKLFVGWLYSDRVETPDEEKDLSPLLDLYLMAEKWEIPALVADVLRAVRAFYQRTDSWPSLRRVQYVYANAGPESPLRGLLVSCVARMLLVTRAGMPAHWEKAMRKNPDLAVDVILCIQKWNFDPDTLPDARIEAVPKADGPEDGRSATEGGEQNGTTV